MTIEVKDTKEKLKKLHKEDSRIVKGSFICHEPKGGSVTFSYRKYRQDPVKKYTLKDGETYELPVGVAKHVNDCGWDVHSNILDSEGNPTVVKGKRERRFTFQSIDFL